MLASGEAAGQEGEMAQERPYSVVAVVFFKEREIARYPTREQAEWKAKELNALAERDPRGGVQYRVRPVEERLENG